MFSATASEAGALTRTRTSRARRGSRPPLDGSRSPRTPRTRARRCRASFRRVAGLAGRPRRRWALRDQERANAVPKVVGARPSSCPRQRRRRSTRARQFRQSSSATTGGHRGPGRQACVHRAGAQRADATPRGRRERREQPYAPRLARLRLLDGRRARPPPRRGACARRRAATRAQAPRRVEARRRPGRRQESRRVTASALGRAAGAHPLDRDRARRLDARASASAAACARRGPGSIVRRCHSTAR